MASQLNFKELQDLSAEILGVDPDQVQMDKSFQRDLAADSLDLVELIAAIEVERPAGLLGLVVALAHRFDLAEGAHGQGSDGGLRAAGEHGSRLTPLDDLGRFPDAVAGGGAGADDRVVRAPGAGVDRHQARGHVADHHRHREGRDAAHPPLQQRGVVLLDLLHAPDAR